MTGPSEEKRMDYFKRNKRNCPRPRPERLGYICILGSATLESPGLSLRSFIGPMRIEDAEPRVMIIHSVAVPMQRCCLQLQLDYQTKSSGRPAVLHPQGNVAVVSHVEGLGTKLQICLNQHRVLAPKMCGFGSTALHNGYRRSALSRSYLTVRQRCFNRDSTLHRALQTK